MRLLFSLFLLSSCSMFFGAHPQKTAKGSQYSLSFQAAEWTQKKDEHSDYVFEHNKDGRILLSNSFCNEFQEPPLDQLAKKTFNGVDNFKEEKSAYSTFHNREAYRLGGSGTVDGVRVSVNLLNTRRNNCYFDFVSINPRTPPEVAAKDFETFLGSVEFK